jgi:uncharacterized protein YkwD
MTHRTRLAALLLASQLALVAPLVALTPSAGARPADPATAARAAERGDSPTAFARQGAASDVAAARKRIRKATNAYRVAEGLPRLAVRADLQQVSQRWTRTMARTGRMEHNPDYAGQIPSGWTAAGENVAAGFSVGQVTRAWWGSPGHRANLLGDYTHIGIGYAVSDDGTPYYTQNFARY